MKIMVAGAGSVGIAIAEDLVSKGFEVVVMEHDPAVVEKLSSSTTLKLVSGDACEVASLQAAGVGQVEVVVAATGDDEDNLVIEVSAGARAGGAGEGASRRPCLTTPPPHTQHTLPSVNSPPPLPAHLPPLSRLPPRLQQGRLRA